MKTRMLPLMALILSGCGSTPGSTPPQESQETFELFKMRVETKLDKAFVAYDDLTTRLLRLEKRVDALENEKEGLRIELQHLKGKVAALEAPGAGTAKPPPKEPDLQDTFIRIDAALARLKAGGSADEAAKDLVPSARYAVPRLLNAIGENLTHIEFVKAAEEVLSRCPAEELKGPLTEAARDRARRPSVARVIGTVKSPELGKILEEHVGDASPIHQVEIGKALVACRNRMGVPPLIKALRAPDADLRFVALTALRPLAGNKTFAYDFTKGADDNARAIQAWEAWWDQEGAKLFEDRPENR